MLVISEHAGYRGLGDLLERRGLVIRRKHDERRQGVDLEFEESGRRFVAHVHVRNDEGGDAKLMKTPSHSFVVDDHPGACLTALAQANKMGGVKHAENRKLSIVTH